MSTVPLLSDKLVPVDPYLGLTDYALGVLDLLMQEADDDRLGDRIAVLANLLAPQELGAVYRMIAKTVTQDAKLRLARLAPLWVQLLGRTGKVYSREMLFKSVALYRSATQGAARPSIVCFTGRRFGMFMANARFLEMLAHHPVDVVILTAESGIIGDWALSGSRSFYESLMLLKAALAERGITPGTYLGISAGGGPAAMAALLDGQASGIMISGRFFRPGRQVCLAEAGSPFEPTCPCWNGRRPPLHSIFSAGMRADADCSRRLARLVPQVQINAIPDVDKHNPLGTLAARNKLRPVLDLIVRAAAGQPVNFDLVRMP